MIFCETGAAISAVLIILSWRHFESSSLVAFFLANNCRVFFTALQAGSVQKYGKLFDERLGTKGKMAVWLNASTNGVLLFAGLFFMFFFEHLTIESIVLLDAVTFIINGLSLLLLQHPEEALPTDQIESVPRTNVSRYYHLLPVLFFLDVALALTLCGANTLNLRLIGDRPDLLPLLPAMFGGAAFLSSFMSAKVKPRAPWLWFALGMTLVVQGLVAGHPWAVVGISAFRNLAYWLIYQGISREFMASVPADQYASASAGRAAISISVLASGEFWVGLTSRVPIVIEMSWRAIEACLAPILIRRFQNDK